MKRPPSAEQVILVASDKAGDATLVEKLLAAEFGKVCTSTDPEQAAADFDRHRPGVLVLAFDRLEKSERHNLGLYRHSETIHLHPHLSIVLCGKDEVQRAYALCREGIFDDYVLFWPMTNDAPRLCMSVRLALRILAAAAGGTAAAELAARARRLASLPAVLSGELATGEERIASLGRAIGKAGEDAGAAFDAFSQRLARDEVARLAVGSADGLHEEMGRLRRELVDAPRDAVTGTLRPLEQWADAFREAAAPHLESVRALGALAAAARPTLLVVDDDEFQHKIIAGILGEENYRMLFATSGADALGILRELRPELILMDVMLPGTDGVELMRRIKAVPRLASVPVLMITGRSGKEVVMESLKAGASGFVVKPFDRETLRARVSRALRGV
ncbi:MAG: hypothetical protein Fur0039_15530 [Rhodocyclaceae bacterium]